LTACSSSSSRLRCQACLGGDGWFSGVLQEGYQNENLRRRSNALVRACAYANQRHDESGKGERPAHVCATLAVRCALSGRSFVGGRDGLPCCVPPTGQVRLWGEIVPSHLGGSSVRISSWMCHCSRSAQRRRCALAMSAVTSLVFMERPAAPWRPRRERHHCRARL
jgi:hypothetical protein